MFHSIAIKRDCPTLLECYLMTQYMSQSMEHTSYATFFGGVPRNIATSFFHSRVRIRRNRYKRRVSHNTCHRKYVGQRTPSIQLYYIFYGTVQNAIRDSLVAFVHWTWIFFVFSTLSLSFLLSFIRTRRALNALNQSVHYTIGELKQQLFATVRLCLVSLNFVCWIVRTAALVWTFAVQQDCL